MSGLIYIFTGEGKGKTSAAIGVATRALLLEKKVIWVAFYKQESWGLAEAKLKDRFSNLEMMFSGKGFKIGEKTAPVGTKGHVVVDSASEEEHQAAAEDGLWRAENALQQKPFLLVMDEVMNAVSEGLLESKQVREILSKRGESHVILTGRGASEELIKIADLVTECRKIKHPYDQGNLAVQGLDF